MKHERSLSTHLKLQAFSFSDANSVQIRTQRIEDRRSQRVFSKVQGGGFCVALTSFFFKKQSGEREKKKMISDRSDFRVQIRRLFVVMIRMCYRWICNHPFLLGFVGFLYFLHRTSPLLFTSLVAASPVLICTFVLLGTILSFGEPNNIPEIGKEESETVHEAALFRTEVSRDAATVVERGDKSFTVERFVSTEETDDGNDDDAERLLVESQLSEVEDYGRPFDYRPLVDETLDEVKRDTHVRFEERAFVLDRGEERLFENGGKQVSNAEQNGGSLDEKMGDSKEDQMDVSPVSPWRPMRHEEDEDDDADRDDSDVDSGSDGAESSSPDASMTDIIPMLDELHPLLLSEGPDRGIADGEGSDAASEGPHRRSSSDEGMESDVDSESSESHGEEGDNENEEEDEEDEEDEGEEEEKKEEKDDENKSAIKWTEADQKNVMDLGSLELERNQRLENLIARRRARHNMRVMAERNLIDFDSADIPFNMPPISTARQNPFDLPYDPYDDMGLPPIPGSAPSIMFARRNPFDIPYEPNEEKPDLKGDGFDEEFTPQPPKDPVFRRHESFSVGPSTLGGPRHDRLRPFFVLERLANEGTSYHHPFERQLSEVSESKISSVPDTESVCTILEDDEKKVDEHEHDTDRETETAKAEMASDNDEEKSHSAASDHEEGKSHSATDREEEKSRLSEDSDFDEPADSRDLHHDVAEIILGSAETHHEQSDMMDGETSENRILDDEEGSSDSDSSLSEKEEKTPDISDSEAMLISERGVDLHEEPGTSSQPSFGGLAIHVARGVEDDYHHAEDSFITAHPSLSESAILDLLVDDHHEEPVYDSSPPSGSRFPSFSSVSSSDYKPDLPRKNGEEVQENAEKEGEFYSESIGSTEIHSTSDETETSTMEVGVASRHVTGEASFPIQELGTDGQNNSTISGSEFEDALLDPSSLPLDKNENADHQEDDHLSVSSEEGVGELHEDVKETENTDHQEDDHLSVSSQEDVEELHEDVKETVDTRALDVSASSVDLVSPTEEELVSTGVVEQQLPIDTSEHVTTLEESPDVVHDVAETSETRSVDEGIMNEEEEAQKQKDEANPQTFNADIPIDSYSTLSSGAVEYVETHSFNDEDVPQLEQDPGQSSASEAKEETHPNQTMDIEVDSVNASAQSVGSGETTPSESNRELTWSDKSVVEQSSLEPDEDQVTTRAGPVSVVFSRNITFHEYHDAPEDADELSCLTSDTSSSPAESPQYETPMVGEGSRTEFFHGGLGHVVERLDELTDLHAVSQSPPEVITEEAEADEIKEIDEGLLSELDTIGDFSVKEVVTDSEPGPSSERLLSVADTIRDLGVEEVVTDSEPGPSSEGLLSEANKNRDLGVKEVVTDSEPGQSSIESEGLLSVADKSRDLGVEEVVTDSEPGPSPEGLLSVADKTRDLGVAEVVIDSEPGPSSEGLLSEADKNRDLGVKEVVTDPEPGPSSMGSEETPEKSEESIAEEKVNTDEKKESE
ncbi:unnamed protein product [Microthlaspi erraticum]|uniref:Uncharacterized protein n=1 Tax=Microthlaspi erraticum TaxID=1685480 RepID=A0A6D2KR86_9BRAS|nr:unnamed protein product [Microthlaspi erraticum]